jgi:putative transposase
MIFVWVNVLNPVLRSGFARRARAVIREICTSEDAVIVKGNASQDHVHLLLNMPHKVSLSRIMQVVKGKSSHHYLCMKETI